MEGLSPSPKLFEELMAWSGFTLTGEEASGLEAGESQGLNGYLFILSSEPYRVDDEPDPEDLRVRELPHQLSRMHTGIREPHSGEAHGLTT
ncbi:MAG: hypothetical protein QXX48_07860, partial [Candidatus Korarchaeum sp.]